MIVRVSPAGSIFDPTSSWFVRSKNFPYGRPRLERSGGGAGGEAVWTSPMSRQPIIPWPISISISNRGFLLYRKARTGEIQGQRGYLNGNIKASSKRQVLLRSYSILSLLAP